MNLKPILTRAHVAAGVIALLVAFALWGIRVWDQQKIDQLRLTQADLVATQVASAVQRDLEQNVILTEALASFVDVSPTPTQEEFALFTKRFVLARPHIQSLQLAPGGVIQYVTNEAAHGSVLGADLLDGLRNDSAKRARVSAETVAVGPRALSQGGVGLVVRKPVFTQRGEFWGFATLLLDWPELLRETIPPDVKPYIAFRSIDESGQPGATFLGVEESFSEPLATKYIRYGKNQWSMAVSNNFIATLPSGFVTSPLYLWLAAALALLAGRLTHGSFESQNTLRTAVFKATAASSAALDKLEKENVKRDQVYGMVAHELRTPLSALQMLVLDSDAQLWSRSRQTVESQVNSLLRTLDDMRMLVNPDLGRQVIESDFTIMAFSEDIKRSTESIVASCGFTLDFDLNPVAEIIHESFMADTYRLRTAVINLIRNACLHSGGRRLSVSFSLRHGQDGPAPHRLVIVVSDDGRGIPERYRKDIFELGKRGETSAPGTGMGLYIARHWLEEIDGTLALIPSLRGAAFELTLPLKDSEEVLAAALAEAEAQNVSARDRLATMRVLLVEDDHVLNMLGRRFFAEHARSVDVAHDAFQALERFDTNDYDLVVTDHFMPGMNGDALIEQLRFLGYRGLVIGVTAATLGEQTQRMMGAGADAVLAKPMTLDALCTALTQTPALSGE